jgi:hypothetical protein
MASRNRNLVPVSKRDHGPPSGLPANGMRLSYVHKIPAMNPHESVVAPSLLKIRQAGADQETTLRGENALVIAVGFDIEDRGPWQKPEATCPHMDGDDVPGGPGICVACDAWIDSLRVAAVPRDASQ